MKYKKSYLKRHFVEHSDTDRKNSWYWGVLVKEFGNWHKAEQAVMESKKRADLMYDFGRVFKV